MSFIIPSYSCWPLHIPDSAFPGTTGATGPSGSTGATGATGTSGGSDQMFFGVADVGAAPGTRYLPPGFSSASIAPSSILETPMTRAGTLKNFFVRHNSAPGNGQPVTYTVFVNGLATPLVVSIPSNSISTDLNNTDTVPVVDGDLVTIQISKAASLGLVGAGLVNATANIEVA